MDIFGVLKLENGLSPGTITADQNDLTPTGFNARIHVLRLQTDATRTITGLTGGAAGRVLVIDNVGSFPLILANASTSSSATNRFALPSDIVLLPGEARALRYSGTDTRWRLSGGGNTTALTIGTVAVPAINFAADLDTGMWSPAANTLAWSLAGVEAARLDSTGFGIGVTATKKLEVRAAATNDGVRSSNSVAMGTLSGGIFQAVTTLTPSAADQRLGHISMGGITTGSTYNLATAISAFSHQAWGASAAGSYITFEVTADGATSRTEIARLISTGLNLSGNLAIGKNYSGTAWGSGGILLTAGNVTLTDTSSSGTVLSNVTNRIFPCTLAASSTTIYTTAYSFVVGKPAAGSNVTITTGYGILVDAMRVTETISLGGSLSLPSWTTVGAQLFVTPATLTDTTGSGTIATRVGSSFGTPTFAASAAITITDAATLYISAPSAGTNVTITNAWCLYLLGKMKATGEIFGGSSILSISPTAGVGYAPGAGGAVTQSTNKTTGVTLNKVTGQITMSNASLADATNVKFTVTNSAVAATDVVKVDHATGGTTGVYQVWACNYGSGTFDIVVRNVSGGALGEAIVLNFVVLKGANS